MKFLHWEVSSFHQERKERCSRESTIWKNVFTFRVSPKTPCVKKRTTQVYKVSIGRLCNVLSSLAISYYRSASSSQHTRLVISWLAIAICGRSNRSQHTPVPCMYLVPFFCFLASRFSLHGAYKPCVLMRVQKQRKNIKEVRASRTFFRWRNTFTWNGAAWLSSVSNSRNSVFDSDTVSKRDNFPRLTYVHKCSENSWEPIRTSTNVMISNERYWYQV